MDNQLCQALRSLCFNTGWHYALFWKLNHQVPMVLTLEDACYRNHEHHGPLGRSCVGQIVNNLLGFTLAKMSSHVYALGEGVVGQFHDGWLAQLSAGIRTIAVVAVFPHGVIQLGSFNSVQILEDLNLVNHIRATMVELRVNIPGYNSSSTGILHASVDI
ncbi:hypothetical protein POM88_019536 [Heracleum sosnowskyi]|uniref:Transcription factor MYC/MYB N-terminal domain-containing protein n=1 Tax=Heracleum sosnowskyi TaxID=360622 RepID=A0AAD8IA35_9APIA|nr:hypothetical protein POM88_019536 [Heracleum sosnowskyi]